MKKTLLIILAALVLIGAIVTVIVCVNNCGGEEDGDPSGVESTTEFSTPAPPAPDEPFNGEDDILV